MSLSCATSTRVTLSPVASSVPMSGRYLLRNWATFSASGVRVSSSRWKSAWAALMAGSEALACRATAPTSGPMGTSAADRAVRESRAVSWAPRVSRSSPASRAPSPSPEAIWPPSPLVAWLSSARVEERSVVSIFRRSGSAVAKRSPIWLATAVWGSVAPCASHGPARPSGDVTATCSAPKRFWGRMVAVASAGNRKEGTRSRTTRARPRSREMALTVPTWTPSYSTSDPVWSPWPAAGNAPARW